MRQAPLPPSLHENQPQVESYVDEVAPIEYATFLRSRHFDASREHSVATPEGRHARREYQKMRGIVDVLAEAEVTGADPVEYVNAQLQEVGKGDDDKLDMLNDAALFLDGFSPDRLGKSFAEWRSDQQKAKAERIAKQEQESVQIPKSEQLATKKAQLEAARQNVERAERERIIDEVVSGGAALMHTAYTRTYAQEPVGFGSNLVGLKGDLAGQQGRRNVHEVLNGHFTIDKRHDSDEIYQENGIREAVVFTPLSTSVYENVVTPGQKKMFGKSSQPKVERQYVGQRTSTAAEVIEGSRSDEPAAMMSYMVINDQRSGDEYVPYHVPDSREGNVLEVAIVLPQSVASRLEAAARKDPGIIRDIVDGVAIERLGLSREIWFDGNDETHNHPMRPPYDAWAQAKGGKSTMYFKPVEATYIDKKDVVVF